MTLSNKLSFQLCQKIASEQLETYDDKLKKSNETILEIHINNSKEKIK